MTYKHTLCAGYIAYSVQAIITSFAPLIFYRFQTEFDISLEKITLIVTVNFFSQLVTDIIAVRIIEKTSYRFAAVFSQVMSALGLLLLGILPYVLKNHYIGILLSTVIMAVGAGVLEVIVSPIIEALPLDNKSSRMSILHSFYCWGQVIVVLFSTLFFRFIGIKFWRYAAVMWALLPLVNIFLFLKAPIHRLPADKKGMPLLKTVKLSTLILLLCCMMSAGAAEITMSQWLSFFAEAGLHISKELGDLIGILSFALLAGITRILYSINSHKIKLEKMLLYSGILCTICYLVTALSPWPLLSLIGCAVSGVAIACMWPGTISLATKNFPLAGAALFSALAFSGDLGCTIGPTFVGLFSNKLTELGIPMGEALKSGMLVASIFSFVFLATIILINKKSKKG